MAAGDAGVNAGVGAWETGDHAAPRLLVRWTTKAGAPISQGMGAALILPGAIVVTTVVAMELLAAAVHRFIMHGAGWRWHRSHHEPGRGPFEKNDLYGLIFAAISLLLFVLGARWPALWWVGLGMVVYGLLYAVLHDGFVHRRWPLPRAPRNAYLKRLIQAHRLHHASRDQHGAVSYGFLYAPPVRQLRDELRRRAPIR